MRSVDVPPLVLTNCPAEQSDHGPQTGSFLVAVYAPEAQAVHTRSVRAEPAALTNWPAPQSVQAEHSLAGLPS
jgi:hypothetical protein